MSEHPASHYLRIYTTKLAMAEGGTTSASVEAIRFYRLFVAKLQHLNPRTPIRMEIDGDLAKFTDATNGSALAELHVGTDV